MNFEAELVSIEYVDKLFVFLSLLRSELKEQIGDHAELIWYDSIHPHTGKVWWLSTLVPENRIFLDICDGFFTDYHWDLERLNLTAQNAVDRRLDVYVGNDIYGRGTYGGGIYNTFVAINEIKKLGLSYALFGTARFYENDNGVTGPKLHALNEEKFWFGSN